MLVVMGKGASAGVAIAPIRVVSRKAISAEKRPVQDIDAEIGRFEAARTDAIAALGGLARRADASLGAEGSALFEAHQMMLDDVDYRESVEAIIRDEKANAEYAVFRASEMLASDFSAMEDSYLRERAADVRDVSHRVLAILSGQADMISTGDSDVILAAEDFAPSETALFDRTVVKGLITSGGAVNSHTAIFARTIGIPAIVGVGDEAFRRVKNGDLAAINGDTGEIVLNPDDKRLQHMRELQRREQDRKDLLERYRDKPAITRGGKRVHVFANIGSVEDAALAVENGAEGVGLLRSEFLYLGRDSYPDEDTLFRSYRDIVKTMDGKLVIIRTLDVGADKQVSYFGLPKEENPALGLRAIRICLTRPELFKTQLRAIFRASAFGTVAIMLPMITSLSEVKQAKGIVAEVKDALFAERVPVAENVPVGIMVETPAAAILSDLLAEEVDFFSIGTNDLTQYALALDRTNDTVSRFDDTSHTAVLRLIKMVAENAARSGVTAGICGELAADTSLTASLVSMGITELSVAPSSVLPIKQKITESW